jgi:hypothetical protein
MTELLHRLATPEDRVLFALLALAVGYVVLGALLSRRDARAPRTPVLPTAGPPTAGHAAIPHGHTPP